jgi:hypothetical protein
MSYILLRGSWCHIIVLNVHAPTEDKTDNVKDSYEELERVIDKFRKYHVKILLGDFSTKVGKENYTKISNDNDIIVNFATSKNLKSQKYDVPTSQHP